MKKMLMAGVLCGLVNGCMPVMPSSPPVTKSFGATNLDAQLRSAEIETRAKACKGRLDALIYRAKSQRNTRVILGIVSALGTATTGIMAATLSDEKAQIGAGVAAAGLGGITATTAFIGDPDSSLEVYWQAYSHYEKAMRAADRFSAGLYQPRSTDSAPPKHFDKAKLNNKARAEMLEELMACAGSGRPKSD